MFSDPSSRPSRSHGARLPALAIPHGVACRFRVFSVNRGSEDIGFFASSLRLRLVSPALPGIPFDSHTVWRDPDGYSLLRFRSPSGLSPEGLARHLSMRAPPTGIPLPFGVCVPAESTYPQRSHPSG